MYSTTCKHLKQIRGEEAEAARCANATRNSKESLVNNDISAAVVAAPKQSIETRDIAQSLTVSDDSVKSLLEAFPESARTLSVAASTTASVRLDGDPSLSELNRHLEENTLVITHAILRIV